MIFNNLIQSNFSIFFLLYNISHFHSVPFFFLFSFVFIAIHPIRIFLWEVQLINITIFVLWYSIGMQYFYGIHLIGILPNCEFLLVLEMNCLWVSWFANISLHSGLPSSFLKISFFGHLLWNWSRSHFPGFGLFLIALGDGFQKTLQWCHPNPKTYCSLYYHLSFLCFP